MRICEIQEQLIQDRSLVNMSLYWNNVSWLQSNQKPESKSFVESRKLFIGGIRSKEVSFLLLENIFTI